MKQFFTLCLIVLAFGCTTRQQPVSKKPVLLVSMPPYETIIHQIAEDQFTTISVIPQGVDPHEWEPRPSDMSKLLGAKAWFTIGEEFEAPLTKVLREKDPNLVLVDLSAHVQTLPSPTHTGATDTHYWLSPSTVKAQALQILKVLSAIQPENAAQFQNNTRKLTQQLEDLNREVKKTLAPYRGDAIVTSHDAFTYYCHDYQIVQIVTEPAEGKEPLPKDLNQLLHTVEENRVRVVITEPQHLNRAAVQVAKHFSLPVYSIDPYTPDYIHTIRELTQHIAHE